jgi:membrane protein DedA with SNARE-associated domain
LVGHDGWLIDAFVAWLRQLDGTTAFLAVLGLLALCGLGLPMPEDIILVVTGFLSSLGKFPLWAGIVAGMVGVLSGDAVLFFLGRRYGDGVFQLAWVRRVVREERVEAAKSRVQANARFICFVARFLPGLRSPIYLVAGAMGIPPRTYIMQDGFAASISVPVWVVLGWYFGTEIEQALLVARDFQMWLLLAVGVGIVIWFFWRRRQRRLSEAT